MKTKIFRPVALLMALIMVIFACMAAANSIQTDHGNVDVSRGVLETEFGALTFKLYEPLTATAANPAPGVLLLHGYQNDSETCAAYAIELARRGAGVLSLDEYGHGSSEAGLINRGYVNHRVKVIFGEDSEADGTFTKIGGTNRYKLMMNFSNLSFFDDRYTKDNAGNVITDSSCGGIAALRRAGRRSFGRRRRRWCPARGRLRCAARPRPALRRRRRCRSCLPAG